MIYGLIIDPLLSGLRKSIKEQIPPGSKCLDIACGTGDMVFKLMDHCKSVAGVDFDAGKIDAARKKVSVKGLDHLAFYHGDATRLEMFESDSFDFSILSLAIHQFNPEFRKLVIKEALRISKVVIIADYSYPMPNTMAGYLARFIEFLAGKEHNGNFKHYQANGGIPDLLASVGEAFEQVSARKNSVFSIYRVEHGSRTR